MADRLRWQPSLPSLAGKASSRNPQVFIDIFAPGPAPAYLAPLEEISHDNYRILTIESRCCTFCARTFPHPTALRKHLSEGTVPCKKAQTSQRHGGCRFTFFGWKYSQGSVDPAIRKPLMHTKYAKLEEFQNLEHSQKAAWLTKVFPSELPQTSAATSPEASRTRILSPSQAATPIASSSSSTAVLTPAPTIAHVNATSISASASITGLGRSIVHLTIMPTEQPQLIRAESVASSDSDSVEETPATHYIPSVHLPNWEDGFATIPFHQQHILPHDIQGHVTPLRRDRNFYKHFLLVELEAIRVANNDYFNTPTNDAEQAMRRRWDRPLHISSPASPYINAAFVDPGDTNRPFFDWYAGQVLKSERYPDGSLRATAQNSPSFLSSPWPRNGETEPPPPEIIAMFGIGGQLEPQQPILPYTTAYDNHPQFAAHLPVQTTFVTPEEHAIPPDFNVNPPTHQNGFYHGWAS
ncbi:hypothetical protein DACRYDRAFT_105892 [Dacryopinax primogenitus]|uniref:Uncharacterized protein n=1 Tax=Dacryopinax primogenitus (strain DJM 731) TaxID=1858805 RepID=M5G503_DACPD|nr:uncharacterized protein DACRYDRAFT_105892 [Dacryopinax primogenitus]EJU03734.1 hypothetical protein DACRYDRAFT_105892 [Dacryopinax primogenitus]